MMRLASIAATVSIAAASVLSVGATSATVLATASVLAALAALAAHEITHNLICASSDRLANAIDAAKSGMYNALDGIGGCPEYVIDGSKYTADRAIYFGKESSGTTGATAWHGSTMII